MMTNCVSCVACGTRMSEHMARVFDDRYRYPGYFSQFRCAAFGQFQAVPLLADANMPSLCGTYYARRHIDTDALVRQVGEPSDPAQQRQRWWSGKDNRGQYGVGRGSKVLDYGCGARLSLLELAARGAHAYGLEVDPNVQQAGDALARRIHTDTIDDHPFPGVTFVLVVMNKVLERIPQPHEPLGKPKRRFAPGRRIAVSFPNTRSRYCRYFGGAWIERQVPYRLYHLNPRSAQQSFVRHERRVKPPSTITPSPWSVLQFRAAVERTRTGVPHPMSTSNPGASEPEPDIPPPVAVRRAIHTPASRPQHRSPRRSVALFNRAFSATGFGYRISETVEPMGTPDARARTDART